MRRAMTWTLGLALTASGLTMLPVPSLWYAAVPGVAASGTFNPHFVRDVGVAYVATGAALTWFASSVRALAAAQLAAAFLMLHAVVHLWDVAAGREQLHQLLTDLLPVFVPPVLAIWIVWADGRGQERRRAMMKWFLRRWIDKFERTWSYDASYLRDILDADPHALLIFSKVTGIGAYHKDVPLAVYSAAGIVAVMSEDCGPCTQLGIDMAQRAGVDPAILRAVVARDFNDMPEDVALAVRFAESSLRHAPEADDLRVEILRRFGKRGLVSLAFAVTAARLYPTLKYAMGHGRACMRVTIGGESRPVLRELTRAA